MVNSQEQIHDSYVQYQLYFYLRNLNIQDFYVIVNITNASFVSLTAMVRYLVYGPVMGTCVVEWKTRGEDLLWND